MLLPPVSYGPKTWPTSTGADRYRRALYTFRYRSLPYPVLQTFDGPNGDFSCVRRVRSNTPLQALVGLNEPVAVECAQALARRTLGEAKPSDGAGWNTHSVCASRDPLGRRAGRAGTVLRRAERTDRRRLAERATNQRTVDGDDDLTPTNVPGGAAPTELAAWTAVSRVLLNLDETITKE